MPYINCKTVKWRKLYIQTLQQNDNNIQTERIPDHSRQQINMLRTQRKINGGKEKKQMHKLCANKASVDELKAWDHKINK